MSLLVGAIMTRDVFAVAPDTSLVTAARLMAVRHITGVPVVDENTRPVGVVTQTDLVDPDRDRTARLGKSIFYRVIHQASVAYGDDAMSPEGLVSDVMSPFVLATSPDALVLDAVKLMVTEDVHRMLVTAGGKLVGIVTSMDVMRALVLPFGARLGRDLRRGTAAER